MRPGEKKKKNQFYTVGNLSVYYFILFYFTFLNSSKDVYTYT